MKLSLICLIPVIALMTSCTDLLKKVIQEPKVTLSRVSLKDLNASGATLLVGVQVENPNAFALKVDSLKYNIELGGKPITTSELSGAATVSGHGTQVVEIPVPVKFQDLYSSALDLFSKNSSKYRITGEARFGLLSVPFDQTGEVKLR